MQIYTYTWNSWPLRFFLSFTSRLYFYMEKSFFMHWIHSDNIQLSNFENQCLYNGYVYTAGYILWCNRNNQTFMISLDALCFHSFLHWLWKNIYRTLNTAYIKQKIFISFHIIGFVHLSPFDTSRPYSIWIHESHFMCAFWENGDI